MSIWTPCLSIPYAPYYICLELYVLTLARPLVEEKGGQKITLCRHAGSGSLEVIEKSTTNPMDILTTCLLSESDGG